MKPFKEASKTELQSIHGVCLDVDETLSTRGKLTSEAYSALWRLQEKGLAVVPLTGRPAGWCDHMVRFWPVDGVVGENGAFSLFFEKGQRRRVLTENDADTPRIQALGKKIRAEFSHAQWASDQNYREFDLAIDICEDVPTWADQDVERLLKLCKSEGAQAKLSSVHVNAWFGSYTKSDGFQTLLRSVPTLPQLENWLFIGDSPNDEPSFQYFGKSVGVANLAQYQDQLKHLPTWITAQASGAGFVEMVDRLLEARSS